MSERTPSEDERTAAYRAQIRALGLKPWQSPPCCYDPDETGRNRDDRVMINLLRRMLAAGVSRWAHDPLAELEEAAGR
jgi:hypothetical protein